MTTLAELNQTLLADAQAADITPLDASGNITSAFQQLGQQKGLPTTGTSTATPMAAAAPATFPGANPAANVGTTGGTAFDPLAPGPTTVTSSASNYVLAATGGKLNLASLWSTAGNQLSGSGQTVDSAAWTTNQITPYIPQLALYTLQQAFTQAGATMTPAQQQAALQAIESQPGLVAQLAGQYSQWFTDTAGSYSTQSALQTKLMTTVISQVGSLGAALGPDVSSALGLSTGILGQGGIVSGVSPQESADRSAQLAAVNAYMAVYGKVPSASVMNQLAGMDAASLQNWEDEQPYHGLNYGTYNSVQKELISAGWQQWFGNDPSDSDVKWAVGKSSQDITARIDQSSYNAIPGTTIGQYKAFSAAGADLSNKVLGYDSPDALISLMKQSGVSPEAFK